MNLKEKVSLKIFQRHLKKSINKDGTVNIEKFKKLDDNVKKFNIGWYLLGFFLGVIGLIIVLFIKDENRKARIKWTATGWLTAILFVLILSAAAAG